jgi:hypothetical protein
MRPAAALAAEAIEPQGLKACFHAAVLPARLKPYPDAAESNAYLRHEVLAQKSENHRFDLWL